MVKKERAFQACSLAASYTLLRLLGSASPDNRAQSTHAAGSNNKGGELSFTRPRSTRVPPTLCSAPRGYPTLPAIQVVVDIAGLANCMNGRSARLHVLCRILCG